MFLTGEEAFRESLDFYVLISPFHIHAQIAAPGDREQGQVARMRQVESNIADRMLEAGLTLRGVREAEFYGGGVSISAEDGAERSAGYDKVAGIFLEVEP